MRGDGTVVAFAAAPDHVAYDGIGGNSPFTTGLLHHLADAGADVVTAFTRVMRDVRDATANRQSPQMVSSLATPFYFGDAVAPSAPSADEAERDYARAEKLNSPRAWHLYIEKYPDGFLSELARQELQNLLNAGWNEDNGIDPEDTEQSLNFGRQARVELQTALSDLGYNIGRPDGVLGSKTRRQIAAFQRASGLTDSGYISYALLAKLGIPFVDEQAGVAATGKTQRLRPGDLIGLETDPRLLAAVQCLNGKPITYGFYGGHLYIAVQTLISGPDAIGAAKQCGGHLVTISSAGENNLVFSLVRSDRSFWTSYPGEDSPREGPFVGLVQDVVGEEPSGGWHWVTGESMSFAAWGAGEPSQGTYKVQGVYLDEDQVQYSTDVSEGPAGGFRASSPTWSDMWGPSAMKGYIMEID